MKRNGYISSEFKQLFKKKSVLISVVIALLVPLVYAMIVLSPKWGPYDNIDNLPVAVVNNDAGVVSNGERINIGEQLIDSLQENRALGWDFVSSDEANRGMENLKYYMVIEVPEDFSEKALTVMDDHPERPELNFIQNEGLHFMAAQVTKNAIELVKNQLSASITGTYVKNVFDQLGEVGEGFQEAADGAEQINDGADQLKDGSGEILSALTDKSGDIRKLADGAQELNEGTRTMRDSLVSKQGDISKLAAGANELNAGTGELLSNLRGKSGDIKKLADGANQLHAGTTQLQQSLKSKAPDINKLAVGANELSQGNSLLLAKVKAASPDIKRLSEGAGRLAVGAEELLAGEEQLLEGIQGLQMGMNDLQGSITSQIIPGAKGLKDGLAEINQGTGHLIDGINNEISGIGDSLEKLLNENPNLKDNQEVKQIQEKLANLASDDNKARISILTESVAALASGANALHNGLIEINNAGFGQLNDGVNRLVAGQKEIIDNLTRENPNNPGLLQATKMIAVGAENVNISWHGDGTKENPGLLPSIHALNQGAKSISDGNQSVKVGWTELQQGAGLLHAGSKQVADGNKTVHSGWNQLAAGAEQLHAGSSQIADGNRTVESGWYELSAGATQLHDGSSQIAEGNRTVKEGWDTLTDGVSQVDDGLAQLVDGSDELKTGLQGGAERTSEIDPAEENIAMFAEPVVLSGEVINSFPFYRDSNAPYILTLALYVGILVMSFVVAYERPATLPSSPITWFIGKVSKLSALAIAQALIISLYSLLILNIEVQSALAFVLYSLFVSLTFLMIILCLVVLAGNIGRFIALAFVVLQLSTTGSALPVHMLPEGLRNLSVFLPFTYSIKGYRNIITLGNFSEVWSSIAVLFIYFLVFAGVALTVFFFKYRSLEVKDIKEIEEAV